MNCKKLLHIVAIVTDTMCVSCLELHLMTLFVDCISVLQV